MWSTQTDGTLLQQVSQLGVPLLLDTAIKATVLLLLVNVATAWLRRASSALRHLIWFSSLAGLLALPAASLCIPGWHILPRWSSVAQSPRNEQASTRGDWQPAAVAETRLASDSPGGQTTLAATTSTNGQGHPIRAWSWHTWGLCIWTLGAAIVLLPWLLGSLSLRQLERQSRRVEGGPLATLAGKLANRVGSRRNIRLLVTMRRRMPMHWGIACPRVLLPAIASKWPTNRISTVLLHELAHVRRWDCLTQMVARIVCALYWFHPLVWWAERQMRAEAESACDDMTLTAGCPAPDYAEHLLLIASNDQSRFFSGAAAIGMARRSCLEDRVRRILDCGRNRRSVSFTGTVACVALVAVVLSPLALLRVQANQPGGAVHTASNSATRQEDVLDATGPLPIRIGYVDDTAEGRRSIAGSGHAIEFERPRGARYLMAVEIHASRYGYPEPPAEDFHLYVLDENQQVIQAVPFPYSLIERAAARWYTLKLPAVRVPKKFFVALSFNPHQTKGIYLGFDEGVKKSHSYIGRPTRGYQPVENRFDWMIRSVLVHEVPTQNPFDGKSD